MGASRGRQRGKKGVVLFIGQYYYWPYLTGKLKSRRMNQNTRTRTRSAPQKTFERLRRQLSRIGYLSQGSVQDRTARKGGGAGCQWTRKVSQKTVTVALTRQQFSLMRKAVGNYRTARRLLQQMEAISRRMIFEICPHPALHKRLRKKVLGTN
jgi:hypothetical protein